MVEEIKTVAAKKVMIVEDNHLNQKISNMIIDALGHKTIQVFDGDKAFDVVKENLPDLIILDIQLTNISGIEICQQVKADEKTQHIPVIVVTALATDQDKKKIVSESGCDSYIAKPFMPKEFSEEIAKYIPIKKVDWSFVEEAE
jgi:two-component system, cell cycle response regulator DivK